jgi:hypothetical protein
MGVPMGLTGFAIILLENAMSTAAVVEPATDLQQGLDRLVGLINSSQTEGARAYVKELVCQWPDSDRVQHWMQVLEPPRVLAKEPASAKSFTENEIAWL